MQTGVLGKAFSSVVGCAAGNCGSCGWSRGRLGGGNGAGEDEGESVRSITLRLDWPGDDGRLLEGRDVAGMLTIDGG
jgi:hypothetical protein